VTITSSLFLVSENVHIVMEGFQISSILFVIGMFFIPIFCHAFFGLWLIVLNVSEVEWILKNCNNILF